MLRAALRARPAVARATLEVKGASRTGTRWLSSKANAGVPSSFEEMEQLDADAGPYARSVMRVGSLLGEQMSSHSGDGAGLLAIVERLRHQARRWRQARDEGSEALAAQRFEQMVKEVSSLKNSAMRDVARAFAHFLALSNAAEQAHRVMRLRGHRSNGSALFPDKRDSCAGTLEALLAQGVPVSRVQDALTQQKLEIVLTAHPTQVHRRTLLAKHRRVTELLASLESQTAGGLAGFERGEAERELRGVVGALWGSDELHRSKPTPQKEARGGLAVVETSLWEAVPGFLRKLDATLKQAGGALPLSAEPVRLASWMGGDRDGNPNVTAAVTREVVAMQRRKGAAMLIVSLDALRLDLSVKHADATVQNAARRALGIAEDSTEPYKAVCDHFARRLRATIAWADKELSSAEAVADWPKSARNSLASEFGRAAVLSAESAATPVSPLFAKEELQEALLAMHASLCANGFQELADGRLTDTIRRVGCFGLQLAPLDVRQESNRHANAIDALRHYAGVGAAGSYLAMSEPEKIEWLSLELESNRPLLRRGEFERLVDSDFVPDAVDRDVLATCAYVADAPQGSFGAYVISQATSAADVLAVELLLAEAGAGVDRVNCARVVPLFETLDDLNNGPDSLHALFAAPGYLKRVKHTQEIMVGYSDSAKDAGRLAASWAQYEAQEKMLKVAQDFGVQATFFHGKGGTVGRGGNPETYRAILAHPPKTIDGRFRITEQGEMIAINFGEPRIAERTLDIFTAAVLTDKLLSAADDDESGQAPLLGTESRDVRPEWRDRMAELSRVSCDAYRATVKNEPAFVPYFRAATPELELSALNVGSRPAKRNPTGGVESLRAIPWIFAWTQTRLNLPAWLGIGAAFHETEQTGVSLAELQEMYAKWPWFRTNVDLIETLLAKTESALARHYDDELLETDATELLALGAKLRADLETTTKAVLAVSGRPAPACDNLLLQTALKLRNPYVDVLNLLQVELLKRRRHRDKNQTNTDQDKVLDDALLIAINGIAAGLQNSG